MSFTTVIKTALGGLLLLTVNNAIAAPQDLSVKSISVPAYNMITDTLQSIMPTVNGQRNDFAMQQICALARGEKTQQEVNATLKEKGVDLAKIPRSGSTASLLINGDKEQQQMTCAVYLANSIFLPVNNENYFSKQLVRENEVKESQQTIWSFLTSNKIDETAAKPEQVIFNQRQFIYDARVKMALVQATAQMYAVIAENIQNEKGQYWADYQQKIASIVYNYAPEYLRKISLFYKSNEGKSFVPVNVTLNSFTVANSTDDVLTQQAGNLMFTSKGVPWFGSGKILGKEYFSEVIVINSDEAQSAAQQQPESNEGVEKAPAVNNNKSSKK